MCLQLLQETMRELLPHLPVIRRLIDSLALLDMLSSFAQVRTRPRSPRRVIGLNLRLSQTLHRCCTTAARCPGLCSRRRGPWPLLTAGIPCWSSCFLLVTFR